MRRLIKGLVFGTAALALLGGAGAAKADLPAEALQGSAHLKESRATGRLNGRFQVGGGFLNRDASTGESFDNWNINFGAVGYWKNWFLRADGGLSVSGDNLFGADYDSSEYSFALGHEFAAGNELTWAPWVGYGNFNTSVSGPFFDADFGLRGPLVGVGLNWTPRSNGKLGRLSVFGGFRYFFLTSASDDFHDAGVEGCDGYEFGGGLRYRFTRNWFATAGASYRRFNVDFFGSSEHITDVNATLSVGTYLR